MKSSLAGLRRRFMENELITTTLRSTSMAVKGEKDNVKKWISFF